jgi:hypothetical protein
MANFRVVSVSEKLEENGKTFSMSRLRQRRRQERLMKFFITYFYNVRFFLPNMVPVSTAYGDPAWYHGDSYDKSRCFVDQNGVMNGIREESFLDERGGRAERDVPRQSLPLFGQIPALSVLRRVPRPSGENRLRRFDRKSCRGRLTTSRKP